MDKDVKDQLNRIESKIDGLTNILEDSLSERKPIRRVSKPDSCEPRGESKISLEELNARLDRL